MRITGITEDIAAKDLEKTLIEFFQKHGISISEQDIERAHRSLRRKPKRGAKPRDIVIAFSKEKTLSYVWRKLRKDKDLQFQGERIIICPDSSPETIHEIRLMEPFAQKLHENGILFSWGYPASIQIFRQTFESY